MTYEIYRRKNKQSQRQWRWRYIKNGRTIFVSSESYWNKKAARKGIDIAKASSKAPIIDTTTKGAS